MRPAVLPPSSMAWERAALASAYSVVPGRAASGWAPAISLRTRTCSRGSAQLQLSSQKPLPSRRRSLAISCSAAPAHEDASNASQHCQQSRKQLAELPETSTYGDNEALCPKNRLPFPVSVLNWLRISCGALAVVSMLLHSGGQFGGGSPLGFASLSASQPPAAEGVPGAILRFIWDRCNPLTQTTFTGLAAGCLHTLTGADHLAALVPLTVGRSRLRSAVLGALWGAGHGSGQLLLGAVFVVFKDQLTQAMPLLTTWSCTLVGLTLAAIGVHGLREAQELRHAAEGAAAGAEGGAVADPAAVVVPKDGGRWGLGMATYGNGLIFGLQPDALMVVLPALAMPSRVAAAVYVTAFMLGTVAAMGSYTACIGSMAESLGRRLPRLHERLAFISGIVAILLGVGFVATNFVSVFSS